ncbi:MAG: aminotransferase class III-fold pyridoxal phosphate-dependent enzyme [Bradymonadia bacterium]
MSGSNNPDAAQLEARQRAHVLYTWAAQARARPVKIAHGDGAVFYDHDGGRWLDFESQVFNCNLGHNHRGVIEAIQKQAEILGCAHPAAVFEAKAAVGEALAAITPGDLNHFFLCLSGAEAVENAYKIARMVTGRHKVIARRQSYHGASMGAASITGDPRRWPVEPGLTGVARVEDPYCYRCPFGQSYPSCGVRCAEHLEHVIQMEGPHTIAAVFMEGITGAVGGFIPPDDYWPRVREICDAHGILLVADEVLSGFGRTGQWFAVDHYGVVPDMITMAKGITGGYAPMGAVAMRPELAAHFEDETLWCGLTNYAHPLSCAAAVAAIEAYQSEGLIDHAAALGDVLAEELQQLADRHPVIGDVRNKGLWGAIELVRDRDSRAPLTAYAQSHQGQAAQLGEALRRRGLHIPYKWSYIFIAPPLCIDAETLREGLAAVDEALGEVFHHQPPEKAS